VPLNRLFGCYESLNGGELAEALEDFTGGVSESCHLIDEKRITDARKRNEFFEKLVHAAKNNAIMCAAIPVS
jgi:calpain-5